MEESRGEKRKRLSFEAQVIYRKLLMKPFNSEMTDEEWLDHGYASYERRRNRFLREMMKRQKKGKR